MAPPYKQSSRSTVCTTPTTGHESRAVDSRPRVWQPGDYDYGRGPRTRGLARASAVTVRSRLTF
eukprot:669134-Prymnesium_polylepis.1